VKKALREAAPAAGFAGGLGLLCLGLSLIYLPLGLIVAGAAAATCSALYERNRQTGP
jgi:hypothetical protein